MSLEDLLRFFSIFTVSLGAKIFLSTFIVFYLILALITLRQVQLMLEILDETAFSPVLKLLAMIHFLAAAGLFVLALVLFLL